MIIVIVEHFLDKDGHSYFPEWVQGVELVLKRWPGFIDIQVLQNVERLEANCLLLRFENLELLRKWAVSEDHQSILDQLAPYREKKQQSQLFELSKPFA